MLSCGRFEPVLRTAQPVLMVVSCLCLCLGSCFPSSDPLNRMTPSRGPMTGMSQPRDRTVHRTTSDATTASPPKVFTSSNSDDPYFRNMDTILRDRLESLGQIPNTNPPPVSSNSVNSTDNHNINNNNNINNNGTTSNGLVDNSLPKPRKSRHRHRTEASVTSLAEQRQRHKSKKRERLSQKDAVKPSRTSASRRLPSRAGKKKKGARSGGLESRTARTNPDYLRTLSLCESIERHRMDIRQLRNTLSWALAVYPDGTVNGTQDYDSNIYTLLVFVTYRRGFVRIHAEAANRYVCMDSVTGVVFAAEEASLDCIFYEAETRNWMTTYSVMNSPPNKPRWHLGISKKGGIKKGRQVRGHQLIAQFAAQVPSFLDTLCSEDDHPV